jgi:hypothetical protein
VELLFSFVAKRATLIRRSTVLRISLQLVFPAQSVGHMLHLHSVDACTLKKAVATIIKMALSRFDFMLS